MSRILRVMFEQMLPKEDWATQIESVRAWCRAELAKIRENDDALPLNGMTYIYLFSGGMGGFGIALNQQGAKCILAFESDLTALSACTSRK